LAITISVDHSIVSDEATSIVSNSITALSGDSQLFILVTVDDITEGDIASISDSEGETITQLADFTNGNRRVRLYSIASPNLNARTITVNFGGATDAYLDLFTVQGSVTDVDPSDVTTTNNARSLSPLTSITPNAGAGMIIWLVHQSSNSTYSALGGGQSERGMAAVGGAEKSSVLFTSEIFTTPPGDQTATASKSADWIGLAVEIKQLAGATAVGRTFNVRHDVLNLVERTFNVRHDVLNLVARTFNVRHDILVLVGRPFNLRHDLAELVGRTFNLRHDLAGAIGRTFNLRHDIEQFVNRTFNVRHDILNLIGRSFSLRHDISQLIGRAFNLRYDLAGAVGRIFTIRHDIAQFVSRTFNIRYDILVLVERTFNVRYDIIQLVNRTFNIRHDIIQLIGRTFNIRHDITILVERTFNLRHDILTLVNRTFTLRHDIAQFVGRAFTIRHDIVLFVGRTWILRHDITQPSLGKYQEDPTTITTEQWLKRLANETAEYNRLKRKEFVLVGKMSIVDSTTQDDNAGT